MPEPIGWQIQADLKSALDNIDGTGDYFYNLAIDYLEYDQNTFNALDALISTRSVERVDDDVIAQARDHWEHTFDIRVAIPVGTGVAGEHDQRLLRAFTDVARAVMTDPQRSTLAIDTIVTGYDSSEYGSKRLACTVGVVVRYRTNKTDLTTK